jgi:hypothetical protein
LQRLGVRLEVTETVLGHVSGSRAGVVGIYQRHHFQDEARAALIAWAEHVTRLGQSGLWRRGGAVRAQRLALSCV